MGTLDPCQILKVLVIFLSVINGLNASGACRTGCPSPDNGKFRYQPGTTYNYNFESTVTVALSGPNSQNTSLAVGGKAQIHSQGNCAYVLKLDSIRIQHDRKEYQIREDLEKPVQFTMSSGQLDSQICADSHDTEHSLNIKRAIISLLQSTSSGNHETDVFGVCPTTISTTRSGDVELITKMRNLNACGHRETLANGFVMGIINEKSGVKSTPLLTADYSAEQRYANGIIESVHLIEEYRFIPFSNQNAGAKARVVTHIQLTGNDNRPLQPSRSAQQNSIIFKNPTPKTLQNADNVRNQLKSTIDQFQTATGPAAAAQFTDLIHLMRYTTSEDLRTIWAHVKSGSVSPNKELAQKIYLDALFRAGTGDSIHATAVLIRNRQFVDKELKMAYLSFNLAEYVSKEALVAVNTLFDANPPNEAYLSVGNIVNKYCKQQECETAEIQAISDKFVSKLNRCQAATKQDENIIISVLKGMRNTQKLTESAAPALMECTTPEKSSRVRVAAIQAFTAAACNQQIQNRALELLRDRNEDSEIRIEGYLAAVTCPNANVANQLSEIINTETVYQVGTFITSHLKSIRDSTDLHRGAAREHFRNIPITKKFPIDIRRLSFNHEFSYELENLGLGASADYSLIYSQRGFLPRSAKFNLTGEMFGTSFNLLEVNLRQENLEYLLEHYFGPKGAMSGDVDEVIGKVLGAIFGDSHERAKRSLGDDVNGLKQRSRFPLNEYQNLNFDYSVKMFGNELAFLSLGEHMPISPKDFSTQFTKFSYLGLNAIKDLQYKSQFHSLFLDTELVYPTGIGFPLQLIAQGAAVGSLEVQTNVDLEQIYKQVQESNVKVKLIPSSNVEISGKLNVDAFAVSTGLKVAISMHSSTGADVNFKIFNQGRDFDLDINMATQKQEIFTMDHTIDFVVAEPGQQPATVPLKVRRKDESDCIEQGHRWVGVTLCYNWILTPGDAVGAPFPLNGPNRLGVSLEMEGRYNINGKMREDPNTGLNSYQLEFDTPGSQIPRRTVAKLEFSIPEKFIRGSLHHPQKILIAEAGFNNNDNEIGLFGKFTKDAEISTAKIGLQRTGGGGTRIEYRPVIEISRPNERSNSINGYTADGKVINDSGEDKKIKLTLENFSIRHTDKQPVVINGLVVFGSSPVLFETDVKVDANQNRYDIINTVKLSPDNIVLRSTVKNARQPDSSHHISIDATKGPNFFKNELELAFGNDLAKKMKMNNYWEYAKEGDEITDVQFKNVLTAERVNGLMKINGQFNKKLFNYDIEVAVHDKKIGNSLTWRRDTRVRGEFDMQAGFILNKYNAQMAMKRTIDSNNKSKLEGSLDSNWGTRATIRGEVAHTFTAQDAYVVLEGTCTIRPQDGEFAWAFDFKGTTRNTQSNGKISRGADEIMSYHAIVNRGENINGKFDATVKDIILAKGDFKLRKGAGDGNALFHIKKVNKKIKLVSTFTINAPTYDLDTTVFYDFEKDNEKKVHLVTKNHVEKGNFDTKNNIEVGTEHLVFNANTRYFGKFTDGEVMGHFDLTLPTGRLLTGDLERKVQNQNDLINGNGKMRLADKMPNNQERSLVLEATMSQINLKTKTFEVEHHLTLTDFEGKTSDFQLAVNHLPNGQYKKAGIAVNARGNLFPNPILLNFNVDEYCPEHAVYRMSGRYGATLDGNLNGNYHVGDRAKPSSYEISMNLNAPNTEMKTYKFESSGKILQPQAIGGIYEAHFQMYEAFGAKEIRGDFTCKGNENHGSWNLNYNLPNSQPVAIEGSYVQEEQDKNHKYQYHVNYKYQGDKEVRTSLELVGVDNKAINVHYILQTPYDNVRKMDLTFKAIKSNENTLTTSTQLAHNDKTYGLNTVFTVSDSQSSADITAVFPDKTVKFYVGGERLGERKGRAKFMVENFGDFSMTANAETSFQSYENFYINVDVDSPKLNLNQVHIEAKSQPNSGGKGVEFLATSAERNILSGNAQYSVKNERDGKVIVEGQGNVRLYDQPRNANFKLIRQTYDLQRDSEIGFSYSFDGVFGPKKVISELKITNKNFNVKLASCEDKKPCTNFEIRYIQTVDANAFDSSQNSLTILIDLRELGYPHEFELQSKTSRNGFKVEHELEANIISNNNNRYQFIVSFKPSRGLILLKLPRREIALEGNYIVPEQIFGQYESSLALYLDKTNRPDDKTMLSFTGTVSRTGQQAANAFGKFQFVHPTVKPLVIQGSIELNKERQMAASQIEFDVFKDPNYKIIATAKYQNNEPPQSRGFNITSEASVHSDGFGFRYEANGHTALSAERRQLSYAGAIVSPTSDFRLGSYFFGSPEQFELLITGFNEEILHTNGVYDRQNNKATIKSTLKFLGSPPIDYESEMLGITSAKVSLKRRDNLFSFDAGIQMGREASALIVGSGKNLFSGRIALDAANFLTSQYEIDERQVETFMTTAEQVIKQDVEQARGEIERRYATVSELFKRQYAKFKESLPDFSALHASYDHNLRGLLDEISADPAIRDFIESYKKLYEAVSGALIGLSKSFTETYGKFSEIASEFYSKAAEVFKTKILPAIQQYMATITEILSKSYVDTIKLLTAAFERAAKALKVFEADFNKLGRTFGELFRNYGAEFDSFVRNMNQELNELFNTMSEYMKSMPGLDDIKQRLEKILSECTQATKLLESIEEFLPTVAEFLPTEQSKQFVLDLHAYVEKKLRDRDQVNDAEEYKKLYSSFMAAIQSLVVQWRSVETPTNLLVPLPFSWDMIKQLPTWSTLRLSSLNYFRNEKLGFLRKILFRRFPYSPLPPYEMYGTIADGQHIFTFDGRHMTFPGSCSYLLASDYVHNNFSIVATLQDGKMRTVTLIDKETVAEINTQGQLLVNGQPTDFSNHDHSIHVWRRYYTVTLLSEYGVRVICSLDLRVCHFAVNGFYTGRTRGLLGNGNQEPYDDFTKLDGRITENYAEFGNDYALQGCGPVPYVDHVQHHGGGHHGGAAGSNMYPLCKEFFDFETRLGAGHILIDSSNYREACDHATSTSQDKEDAACNIALAYASVLRLHRIPVEVPDQCVKCNPNTPEQHKVGDEFEMQTPQQKADIVLVFDTAIPGIVPDLVQPFIVELRNQLRARELRDTNIILIGYDNNQKYPSLYTCGGRLDCSGDNLNLAINGPKRISLEYSTPNQRANKILSYLQNAIKLLRQDSFESTDAKAGQLAMDYPFRAGANKVIIAMRGDSLEFASPFKAFGASVSTEMAKLKGISVHLMGPIKDLQVNGVANPNVVGFNNKQLLIRKNAPKTKEDNRANLRYTSDLGTTLVSNDGGYVFALQNFQAQNSPQEKKLFVVTMAQSLADYTSRTQATFQCQCKTVYGLHAEEVCLATQIQVVPPRKPAPSRG